MLSGLLGSRLLDRRPPHYRCPAVPGFKASTRAILMVLVDTSVWIDHFRVANLPLVRLLEEVGVKELAVFEKRQRRLEPIG
jgi:hypothetical protein